MVGLDLPVDHVWNFTNTRWWRKKGLKAPNGRGACACETEEHSSRDTIEDVAQEANWPEHLAVKGGFVDITTPLYTATVPLDKSSMWSSVIGGVEQVAAS